MRHPGAGPAGDGTPDGDDVAGDRDWFVRAAAVVGDFGNPFYAEERQRDVWNEASAFGFQLLLWAALLVGTAAVWLLGAPVVPAVLVALGAVGLVAAATIAYAARLGVTVSGSDRVLRPRLLPYVALVVLLAAGVLRAVPPGSSDGARGTAVGLVVGALAAVAALGLGALRGRRRGA